MLSTFINVFKIPDLRKKILFTIALLVIYRMGFQIPVPFFDNEKMQQVSDQKGDEDSGTPLGRVAEYLQMFSGGRLDKTSLFGLGIMPYISASIILMLLGEVWTPLRKLRQEGAAGHKKIQEYTRYLTVPLCVVQSLMIMKMHKGYLIAGMEGRAIFMGVVAMTAGTLFLMWLGEQIDEYGIGNGISLLIMAGIVSRMPWAIQFVIERADFTVGAPEGSYGVGTVIFLIGAFVFVVAGAILITQGQRRIPIQQAKQMRGRRMFGGQRHYLPLRINHGGVMPIIFASSLMMFPPIIIQQIAQIGIISDSERWRGIFVTIGDSFTPSAFTYNFIFVVMIFLFAYFWTTVQFQPKEMAKRLRDNGSFIPGLRPGHRTAEYLETVMIRITYFGASFLAFIAVVPSVVSQALGVDYRVAMFLGGTGLLIVVSVSLDLVQKIEANLIMRNYDGFSESGRIKGAFR
ncbi:MAG: preprotein translocase subunit SecY [Planctomycetes bacterium]|nr:preprotein translocase subunit SecY [Planctomycetota bacterium]